MRAAIMSVLAMRVRQREQVKIASAGRDRTLIDVPAATHKQQVDGPSADKAQAQLQTENNQLRAEIERLCDENERLRGESRQQRDDNERLRGEARRQREYIERLRGSRGTSKSIPPTIAMSSATAAPPATAPPANVPPATVPTAASPPAAAPPTAALPATASLAAAPLAAAPPAAAVPATTTAKTRLDDLLQSFRRFGDSIGFEWAAEAQPEAVAAQVHRVDAPKSREGVPPDLLPISEDEVLARDPTPINVDEVAHSPTVDFDEVARPPTAMELGATLLDELYLATAKPAAPILSHATRLSSGERGVSLVCLRVLRAFYTTHSGLGKQIGDVCNEEGFNASLCTITRCTGLSLAESIVHVATGKGSNASPLVGRANTFFSYGWTGTRLQDMLFALEEKLTELETADGVQRYVWVDLFCASQTLLSDVFLPVGAYARAQLQASDPHGYAACKEDTSHILEDAMEWVTEVLFYCSPLTAEWLAPHHHFPLVGRPERPNHWQRKGPGALTRAWCNVELAKTQVKGCKLHVVLSREDMASFQSLLTERFDSLAGVVAGLDACDALVSKVEDRDYLMGEIKLLGGLGSVTATVAAALFKWLADEGRAALEKMPLGEPERGLSGLNASLGRLLVAQRDLEGAAVLLRKAMQARRETLGDRHRDTLTSINSLGLLLKSQGDLAGAAVLLREVVQARRETLGDRHRDTLKSINNLGLLLQAQGDLAGAAVLHREVVQARRETLGDRHCDTVTSINNLGSLQKPIPGLLQWSSPGKTSSAAEASPLLDLAQPRR